MRYLRFARQVTQNVFILLLLSGTAVDEVTTLQTTFGDLGAIRWRWRRVCNIWFV